MIALLRNLFRPERTVYHGWEWHLMRLAFGVILLLSTPKTSPHMAQPRPNGLAHWMDLTFLADPTAGTVVYWVFVVGVLLYILDLGSVIVLPVLAFICIAAGSLGNSQGAINHVSQIKTLVLVAQLFACWYAAGVYRRSRAQDPGAYVTRRRLLMISSTQQIIAAAYVVSALSKLVNSGGNWVRDVPNLSVQFTKNVDMAYFNTLSREGHEQTLAIIDWMAGSPNMARMLFGSGFVLELLAFLALLNRRMAALVGISLILMHESISRIMHLGFYWNKMLVLIFVVNIPFWIWFAVYGRKNARS